MKNEYLIQFYAFNIIAHIWLASDKPYATWLAIGHAVVATILFIDSYLRNKSTSSNAD